MTRLDHLVILTSQLDRAVHGYEELGFAVTPGGEHADGLTRNELIPFRDGSYLELVAFVDREDSRDNIWGWRRFLSCGGGLIDYCAASDDLRADAGRLWDVGFEIDGPTEGGRRRPDGTEMLWLIMRIRQEEGRILPFLIEDLTPRELRVPGGPAAEHPNGAIGIRSLQIATSHAERTVREFATLAGTPDHRGTSLRLGECTLSLVTPEVSRQRLHTTCPGPFAVGLATAVAGGPRELDRRLSEGVRIRFLEPAAGD